MNGAQGIELCRTKHMVSITSHLFFIMFESHGMFTLFINKMKIIQSGGDTLL